MTIGPDLPGAVIAFNRFGFGARPGDLAAAASDPRGFLLDELSTANVALVRDSPPPSGPAALQTYYLDQQRKRAERTSMAVAKAPLAVPSAAPGPPEGRSMAAGQSGTPREGAPESAKPQPQVEQAMFRAEAEARLQKQLQARVGFVERLVAFWSNHFAVSVAKSAQLRAAAGPFEREAIRPNVLGKFAALLRAAETHPAMILYLDNQNSIGPGAAPGIFAGKGLNENLAREILELHTLGVGSGYTQADVTEFARILTGWSVAGPESEVGAIGSFLFKPNWHEPGQRTLLGKTYADAGVDQGVRRSTISPAIRRRRGTSRPSSCAISSPTIPRPISSTRWRSNSATATATSLWSLRRWSRTIAPGARSRQKSAIPSNSASARRAPPVLRHPIRGCTSRRSNCSACRCGSPRDPTVSPIRATPGRRRKA